MSILPEAMVGLLRHLPKPGEPFPRKAAFLCAFTKMVDYYWPDQSSSAHEIISKFTEQDDAQTDRNKPERV